MFSPKTASYLTPPDAIGGGSRRTGPEPNAAATTAVVTDTASRAICRASVEFGFRQAKRQWKTQEQEEASKAGFEPAVHI